MIPSTMKYIPRVMLLCCLFVLASGCSAAIPATSPTGAVTRPVSTSTAIALGPVASATPTALPLSAFDPERSGELLAFSRANPEFGGLIKLVVLDPLTGGFKPLGEGKPIAWSPSGRFILASADDFAPASIVYDLRGRKTVEEILHPSSTEYTSYQNSTFWLPTGILPGPDDWLVIPDDHENGFEARGIPSGERRTLVPARNISDIDLSFKMLATTTGWLAWAPVGKSLTDIGRSSQTLSAVRVADPAKTHTWVLSEKIEKAYYTLLGAAPGASLLLLGASPAPTFGTDNVALYSFDLESGLLKDLGVTMLSNPSAYAWSPTRPGELALAVGEGHFIGHNKRLALLNVQTGELKYLTSPEIAAFEPDWSLDGKELAYAALKDDGSSTTLSNRAIYVYDLDAGESKIITHPAASIDGWPHWLKDQQNILFVRYDGKQQTTLYLKNLASGAETSLDMQLDATFLFENGRCQFDQCNWGMILQFAR
ncbi:MAG: hypothetical protein WA821_14480 [Anaerolineales bacterium]